MILQDPDVVSLSSFIGVDGTNMTPNSGRIQINLKPREERTATASDIIRRLAGQAGRASRASRSTCRRCRTSAWKTASAARNISTAWRPRIPEIWPPGCRSSCRSCRRYPQLRDVATDQQDHALEENLVVDRDTASRLGLTTSAIDNTLYDAFGQRLVSIMFTQLNQYHVVLEVAPEFRQDPGRAEESVREIDQRAASAAERLHALRARHRFADPESSGPVPGHDHLLQSGSRGLAGRRRRRPSMTAEQRNRHACQHCRPAFKGTAAAFRNSLANESWLLLAAVVTVYIVLGVLYESYIHPLTILSTCRRPAWAPSWPCSCSIWILGVIALIGIILLIGIVKKNAIMMIDFALEAERRRAMPPEEAIYQACLLRFRPIMMTTMAALFGGVPLALGHGTGSELRHPLGIAIIGGLLFSQSADAIHHPGGLYLV